MVDENVRNPSSVVIISPIEYTACTIETRRNVFDSSLFIKFVCL